jgi:sugar phosphate isomerase/epimerase
MPPIDGLSYQLYSGRAMPLDEQFALIAGIGYRKVEPYGGLFDDFATLKRLVDKYNMAVPTVHMGIDRLRADAGDAARMCRQLGVEVMFVPAPLRTEREGDETHWRGLGRELAALGKIVTDEGVKFGWHNHAFEYGKIPDGTTYLDLMFEEAPDMLWQIDMAWAIRGGGDPLAELKKYPGRIVACHVKDIALAGQCLDEDGWADPGHGTMDWGRILPALKAAGVRHFVAEHDKPNDVARFARRAFATVASWA